MRQLFYITLLALNCLAVRAATFPNVFTTNAVGVNGVLNAAVGTAAYVGTNTLEMATVPYNAAVAFANNNNITNQSARSDLINFATEATAIGVNAVNTDATQTNWVDMAFLHPRFNPGSNSLTWTGATITMSNLPVGVIGGVFNGNALLSFPIADSRTNTLIIIWRGFTTNYNTVAQQWLGGLVNNNPANYSAQWVYAPGDSIKFTFRETNTFFNSLGGESLLNPWWTDAYVPTEPLTTWNQRKLTVTTSTGVGGGGIYSFYNNGMPVTYGTASPALYLTNTTIVPNNPLNMVLLGGDIRGPAGGFFGGYFKGEISFVGVINKPITSNQVAALYRSALTYLETETRRTVYVGDSRFAPFSVTNLGIPLEMQRSAARSNDWMWSNVSQGGKKLSGFLTTTFSNYVFYLNAPAGKITRTDVNIEGLINDAYGNGDSLNTMSNSLGTLTSWGVANRENVNFFMVAPLGTNGNSGYVYSSGVETLIDGINDIAVTNPAAFGFSGVVREDLLVDQNVMNTNNGYSLDALHLNGTNGYLMNRKIANLALGLETAPNIGGRQSLVNVSNNINGDLGLSGNLTVSGNSTFNNTTSGVLNVSSSATNWNMSGFSNTNPATGNRTMVGPTNTATAGWYLGASDSSGTTAWLNTNTLGGAGTTYPSPVHTNGFSLFAVFSNTVAIDKQHSLVATNLIQAGSPATADNGAYWLYGTNGHLSRLSGVNAEGVDQAGFSWQLDSMIAAYFGTNHFKFLKTITITNTDGLFVTSPTNLFEAFTTNGGFMVYSNDSSLKINGSLQVIGSGDNGVDALYITNLTANRPVLSDANKKLVSGGDTYTSYASGTAYTLTATPAQLAFGTTSPGITISVAGTYLLSAGIGVKYSGATYTGTPTIALKLRRTNNTAADLTNGGRTVELPVLTTFTGGDSMTTPSVIYTATAGDIIQLFGSVSATPSAGSVSTDSAEIVAIRLY